MDYIALTLVIVFYSYMLLKLFELFIAIHQDAAEVDFAREVISSDGTNPFCPICRTWLDLRGGQRVIVINGHDYACCMHHTRSELADFRKGKEVNRIA
jgi:hypothetical protein